MFDETGRLLPGLSEAAAEAGRIARSLMQRDQAILTRWDEWRVDVREPSNVLLFTLPFSDVLDPSDMNDLIQPEKLPDTEAVWTLWSAARESFSARGIV